MTHALHPYPARMIPQIAERLIHLYAKKNGLVLDPFCGTGGVLLEATRANLNSVGFDVNPLACLISRVKTTPINPKKILLIWSIIMDKIIHDVYRYRNGNLEPKAPDFGNVNLNYWFKDYVIGELSIIRKHIDTIKEKKIKDFFLLCFSHTIRTVSGTRNSEFKLYRMDKIDWENYFPDVLKKFAEKVTSSISMMSEYYYYFQNNKINSHSWVFEADTRNVLNGKFPKQASKILSENSVSLVLTSPPYGDSPTTVAYGQYSRYPLLWLGYDSKVIHNIDKNGGRQKNNLDLRSKTLEKIVSKISDKKRKVHVLSYFNDLGVSLFNISEILSRRGYACIVLGNRTVNQIKIPTDQILREFSRDIGLQHVRTIKRSIIQKRLPYKIRCTKIVKKNFIKTMNEESIVVLKK